MPAGNIYCFVAVLLLVQIKIAHLAPQLDKQNSAIPLDIKFAANVVTDNFNHCTGILYHRDLHSVSLQQFLHQLGTTLTTTAHFITNFKSGPATNIFPKTIKYQVNCLFHIVSLQGEENLDQYNQFLHESGSAYPVPSFRSNTDYFLLLVSETLFEMLHNSWSNALITKIRNKIFIVSDSSGQNRTPKIDSQISVYHVCNYCIPSNKIKNLEQNDMRKIALFPNYIRNLNGHELRASVPSAVVARVGLTFQNGVYKAQRGLQLVILNMLSQEMNFTYKVFPSSGGGGTGLKQPNGSWAGVVGDIHHDRADIGFGVGISIFRNPLIEFLGYYEYISLTFVYGPTQKIYTWRTIFWPFNSFTWIYLFCCVAISFAVLTLLLKEYKGRAINGGVFSFGNILFTLYSTLMGQETKWSHGLSVRAFVSYWLLFVIVISTAYTSKLFGFLAFPIHESAPQTFQELADSNYAVGLRYIGGAGYNSFRTSESPALRKIFQRMELIKDPLACFERALNSRFCCISYELQYEYSVQRNLSDVYGRSALSLAPGRVFPVSVGLGIQKGAIFGEQINWKVTSAFETGLVEKWSHEDMVQTHINALAWRRAADINREVMSDGRDPVPLALRHFTGAFRVLSFGIIAALVIVTCEKFKNNTHVKTTASNNY